MIRLFQVAGVTFIGFGHKPKGRWSAWCVFQNDRGKVDRKPGWNIGRSR